MRFGTRLFVAFVTLTAFWPRDCPAADQWSTWVSEGRIAVSLGGQTVAIYRSSDDLTTRPFFEQLCTPRGLPVTRHHPPIAGKDSDDHADMHPGLWMSFGDLSGHDYWRNQAVTKSYVGKGPEVDPGVHFVIRNGYLAGERPLCEETCTIAFQARPVGYLIEWSSSLKPVTDEIVFGDQEEMGLGVRLHTPLIVQRGGQIRNSDGQANESGVWGKPADWCQYSGVVDSRRVGIAILPSPRNFRRAWWHVRDYGLMVANHFGRNALTGGEKSAVRVGRGETLELRFAILVFDVPAAEEPDVAGEYREYVAREESRER